MTHDMQYRALPLPEGELDHAYGGSLHLLSQPYPMTLLARLGAPETVQPEVEDLLCAIYDWLFGVVASRELARTQVTINTRMRVHHREGAYHGEAIDRHQRAVVVDIARAGMVPAARFYRALNHLLDPHGVRQDHVFANRTTDAAGRVTGVNLSGSKIGGPIDDATLFIPDPMAATGSSVLDVLRLYRDEVPGTPRRIVLVHLVVAPEYVRALQAAWPEAAIYAVRLDRGLSPPDVLATRPGEQPDRERGLDDRQYIVPGAGGLGEVLNNAWV